MPKPQATSESHPDQPSSRLVRARLQTGHTTHPKIAASAAGKGIARHSHVKRAAQIAILLIASVTMLGAGTPSTRFDKLGHKLMCTCGCAEILLECNHMGCPDSPKLIADLHAQLDAGASDSNILSAFAATYGPIVLAAPIRGGFDLVAWIIPFAVLAFGIVGITWLLRHWRDRHHEAAALATASGTALPPSDHVRDRIRRETTYEP